MITTFDEPSPGTSIGSCLPHKKRIHSRMAHQYQAVRASCCCWTLKSYIGDPLDMVEHPRLHAPWSLLCMSHTYPTRCQTPSGTPSRRRSAGSTARNQDLPRSVMLITTLGLTNTSRSKKQGEWNASMRGVTRCLLDLNKGQSLKG